MIKPVFDRIAIIGAGLIGSSIALAARDTGAAGHVALYDADEAVRHRARQLNLGDICETPEAACKDADCVIISFAKANANFGLGLLDDPKRLNVALSRAKRKLVLVGAKDVLAAKSPVFARLLQKASDDAALFTVDDATLPRLPARVPAAETPGAPPHGACG